MIDLSACGSVLITLPFSISSFSSLIVSSPTSKPAFFSFSSASTTVNLLTSGTLISGILVKYGTTKNTDNNTTSSTEKIPAKIQIILSLYCTQYFTA